MDSRPVQALHMTSQEILNTDSMETNIALRGTSHPLSALPVPVCCPSHHQSTSRCTQSFFTDVKTMLTSILGPRQESIRTASCNYLATWVENLEQDFHKWNFKNTQWYPGQSRGEGPPNTTKYIFLDSFQGIQHTCHRLS